MHNKDEINEALNNLYEHSFNSLQKLSTDIIKFYNCSLDSLLIDLEYLKHNEPLKIFKKKHEKWEKEYKNVKKQIKELSKKIDEEYNELRF